ncbi:dihydrodipicolinate synthase family protein [Rhizobium cremeum]|uniref:dihydrodipicolinate synthase family protein n=1 Tax=Rhizobium cremeum TaxID=2813827 RepID=UPI000DD6BC78|nr:dihydrodipicolinate synthase family protein [Rhizobium cremeum]MCJ7997693.1 dihydrodipicolinate synthase family protein [Rhizobium cremeum]MCJ8002787.1 dihydrodipicolinate synthase family protein [Rhizobium cremeum]
MMPFRHRCPAGFTPLLTPFSEDRCDIAALNAAIDRQVAAGMDGIVILDAFGEGHALDAQERDAIISACVQRAQGRLSVIAATGTNCTTASIDLARRAVRLGADALLVTIPYYSKPRLAGVVEHFRSIADAVPVPIIVDDDPGRTAIDFGMGLLSGLASTEGIVAVCHGQARLGFFAGLPANLRRRYLHLSRDCRTLPAFIASGGNGAISPLANVLPSHVRSILDASAELGRMTALHQEIVSALASCGPDDIAALKEATSFIHQHPADVRLPLVAAEPETIIGIRHAFAPFARCEGEATVAA